MYRNGTRTFNVNHYANLNPQLFVSLAPPPHSFPHLVLSFLLIFEQVFDSLKFLFRREAPVDSWRSGRRVLLVFNFLTFMNYLRLEENEVWASYPSKQKQGKVWARFFFLFCWRFRNNCRWDPLSISSCFWVNTHFFIFKALHNHFFQNFSVI